MFAEKKQGLMRQMNRNRIPDPDANWDYVTDNKDHNKKGVYGKLDNEYMKLLFIIAAFDAPKMLIDPYLFDYEGRLTEEGRQAYD